MPGMNVAKLMFHYTLVETLFPINIFSFFSNINKLYLKSSLGDQAFFRKATIMQPNNLNLLTKTFSIIPMKLFELSLSEIIFSDGDTIVRKNRWKSFHNTKNYVL